MTYSIVAEGLVKRFGETRALDGIDLAVRTGSVFGLLGPNGAGNPVTGLWLSLPPERGRWIGKSQHQSRGALVQGGGEGDED
ncbi:MAG: hypothetical protein ACRDNT_15285 [Streptosporangiaceae bacterium]